MSKIDLHKLFSLKANNVTSITRRIDGGEFAPELRKKLVVIIRETKGGIHKIIVSYSDNIPPWLTLDILLGSDCIQDSSDYLEELGHNIKYARKKYYELYSSLSLEKSDYPFRIEGAWVHPCLINKVNFYIEPIVTDIPPSTRASCSKKTYFVKWTIRIETTTDTELPPWFDELSAYITNQQFDCRFEILPLLESTAHALEKN